MQTDIYKHLHGSENIEMADFNDVKGVRVDRVELFIEKGYVVIKQEELSDIVLMGIPKVQQGGAK